MDHIRFATISFLKFYFYFVSVGCSTDEEKREEEKKKEEIPHQKEF